jgi:hypothetical protein
MDMVITGRLEQDQHVLGALRHDRYLHRIGTEVRGIGQDRHQVLDPGGRIETVVRPENRYPGIVSCRDRVPRRLPVLDLHVEQVHLAAREQTAVQVHELRPRGLEGPALGGGSDGHQQRQGSDRVTDRPERLVEVDRVLGGEQRIGPPFDHVRARVGDRVRPLQQRVGIIREQGHDHGRVPGTEFQAAYAQALRGHDSSALTAS